MSLQCESADVVVDVFLAGRSQLGPSSAGDWPDWYSEVTGAVVWSSVVFWPPDWTHGRHYSNIGRIATPHFTSE